MLYATQMLYVKQNVVWDTLSSNFHEEKIEFITKICACYIGCVG